MTRILNRLREGDSTAEHELIQAVYEELRKLARQKLAREAPGHTLQATALVHEAWLRLLGPSQTGWENRAHFFSAAAEAMRRILVDHARRRQSLKRGGGQEPEGLEAAAALLAVAPSELLAVDEALAELAAQDSVVAELIKLRYYVGMSMSEAASALDLAPRTAERLWTFGRAWLRRRLRSN